MKTNKIVAMFCCFVFLCLCWRLQAPKSDFFNITIAFTRARDYYYLLLWDICPYRLHMCEIQLS